MRKVMWVLLGLVIVAGALSLGGYRHWWEPQQRAKATRSAPSASGPATRGLDQRSAQGPATRAPQSGGGAPTATEALSFDTLVNILNVVVGIMGIWMTWVGMRMQRQAMQMSSSRNER